MTEQEVAESTHVAVAAQLATKTAELQALQLQQADTQVTCS